jgi:dihydrofolate reductase
MRKIVLWMSVSIDGFFEGPNCELDWHMVDDEQHGHIIEVLGAAGAFLEGRVMYELMAEYWSTADQRPSSSPFEVKFARIWRETPKFVFSRTLKRADWNSTVVREVIPEEIQKLKDQSGGDMILGGANLAGAFWQHDLIDEYRLYVHPVIIGKGHRPFPSSDDKIKLRLAETRSFRNGVVLLRYQRPEQSPGPRCEG